VNDEKEEITEEKTHCESGKEEVQEAKEGRLTRVV